MADLTTLPLSPTIPGVPRKDAETLKWTSDFTAAFIKTYKDLRKQIINTVAGGSESTTAANVGVAGVGVYKGISGFQLQFKNLNAGSSKVTISDDAGNSEVDIDVNVRATVGWYSVKESGAVGDGTTDDTAAINAAIALANAETPRGVVFFPQGIYKTTGGHDLNGKSGLKILGAGVGTTTIRLAHASNDLFSIGATQTSDIVIDGFTVTSDTVTRAGGWVFHVNDAYNSTGALRRSTLKNLEIRKQFNGLAIKKYEFVLLSDIIMWDPPSNTTGIALQFGQTTTSNINQGSEATAHHVNIYGNDLAGGTHYWAQSVLIEDTDAVYLEHCSFGGMYGNCLKMVANSAGHSPANHFIRECVFDATNASHSFWATGDGVMVNVKITGSWFCSAGQNGAGSSSNGARIDVPTYARGEFVGCNFYNNKGTGLYIDCSGHCSTLVTGCTVNDNGLANAALNNDGIYIDVPINAPGPVITGCQELYAPGVSIRTSATSNRLVIVGNRWVSGTSYGIAPNVNANNGT